MKKDNRPQGGLSDKVVIERLPLPVKVLGQFFYAQLLFVLRNERQQCQYKQSKDHQILKSEIYHRHHLHSKGISATPPCNTVVEDILAYKRIFGKKSLVLIPMKYAII